MGRKDKKEERMIRLIFIVVISLLVSAGCSRKDHEHPNGKVTQEVDVSYKSFDIKGCDVKYELTTYTWHKRKVIFARYRYNLTGEDLEVAKGQDKAEGLAILDCENVIADIDSN